MKKPDLIKQLAALTGISQAQVGNVLTALNDTALDELKRTGEFSVHNLVTLKVTDRAQRQGRNPQTGESMVIPAKKVVKAKATHLENSL